MAATAFTNASDIAGGIAFVRRGTCTFDVKYVNAQAAGARALVVYNDGASPTRVDPLVMGNDYTHHCHSGRDDQLN